MTEMAPEGLPEEAGPINVEIHPSWSDGVYQVTYGVPGFLACTFNYAEGAEALIPALLDIIRERYDEAHEAVVEAVEAGQAAQAAALAEEPTDG